MCSQPSPSSGLGRALGIVEVAAEDVAAAPEHLAVVGQAQLHAGDGPPTVPGFTRTGSHAMGPVDSESP